MGAHNYKWRNYNKDGLRRRYLALLIPALAKVHADHPQESGQLQRAQAVRRAADTCLVQALQAKITSCLDHPHQRLHRAQAGGRRTLILPYPPPPSSLSRQIQSSSASRRGSFSCRLQALMRRGKANAKAKSVGLRRSRSIRVKAKGRKRKRVASEKSYGSLQMGMRREKRRRKDDDREREVEGSIPEESELRRLQRVLFNEEGEGAGDDPGGYSSSSVMNPAALLSQAAHYIMALQVQVEALRALASLSAGSSSSS